MDDSGEIRQRILIALLIVFGILVILSTLFLFWNENQSFASLVALKNGDIAKITVFNNTPSDKSLLLTLDNPKDIKATEEFVTAINNAKKSPPSRDVIASHELYIVIEFNDSRNNIELLLHLQNDCGKTVYIDIVKKPGGVKSNTTTYVSSAKSEIYFYEWLQNLNFINYLGCG